MIFLTRILCCPAYSTKHTDEKDFFEDYDGVGDIPKTEALLPRYGLTSGAGVIGVTGAT